MMARESSYIVQLDEETFRVEVTDGEVRVPDSEAGFQATAGPDGSLLVTSGTRRWRVWVVADGESRQVFVDGEVYGFQVQPAGRARRAAARGSADLLTVPMPARVSRVLVAVGQAVQRGDVVMTLEAMKMELPLRAPRDGTVRSIACREGDLVQPGANLLEIV